MGIPVGEFRHFRSSQLTHRQLYRIHVILIHGRLSSRARSGSNVHGVVDRILGIGGRHLAGLGKVVGGRARSALWDAAFGDGARLLFPGLLLLHLRGGRQDGGGRGRRRDGAQDLAGAGEGRQGRAAGRAHRRGQRYRLHLDLVASQVHLRG